MPITITDEEFKPCPFCGSEAEFNSYMFPVNPNLVYVLCSNENCIFLKEDTPFSSKEEAIKAWNTRAYEAEMQEILRVKGNHERTHKNIKNSLKIFRRNYRDLKKGVWGIDYTPKEREQVMVEMFNKIEMLKELLK